MSKLRLYGSTSGYNELTVPAIADNSEVNIGNLAGNTYVTGTFVSNNYYEAFKLQGPTISSVHPTTDIQNQTFFNEAPLIYITGSGFDSSANVILIANSIYNTSQSIEFVAANVQVHSTSNITFTLPDPPDDFKTLGFDDIDVIVVNRSTNLSSISRKAFNAPYFGSAVGFTYGYDAGGLSNYIRDRFPFATDSNATAVASGLTGNFSRASVGSSTRGYTFGGGAFSPGNTEDSEIFRFRFSTESEEVNVGQLIIDRGSPAGHQSDVNGYSSGGTDSLGAVINNSVDKFPFASEGNATDVGDLTQARKGASGQSSQSHGYASGGTSYNIIDKFPFATDANSTDVGDLSNGAGGGRTGQSSTTNGYASGSTGIEKFPFATDANSTDVGDLTSNRSVQSGQSSYQSGYTSGGNPASNIIDKFPFATDSNATDVGDLTTARGNGSGGVEV